MATHRNKFLSVGWRYLTDGTYGEVREALQKKDFDSGRTPWEYDEHGFRQLRSGSFAPLKIDAYKQMLKDPQAWSSFESENMNKYFHDGIDLFPFEYTEENIKMPESPGRFFRVQQDIIRRRFPSGRDKTPGDADIRDLISTLRYVFSKNFFHLIVRRRSLVMRHALAVLGVMVLNFAIGLALIPGLAMINHPASVEFGVAIGVVSTVMTLIVLWLIHSRSIERIEDFKDQYEAAVRSSCLLLGRYFQMRQQEIISVIPLIFNEADNDKFTFKGQGHIDKWPEEVRKWTKLAFWMAARVEYNEYAMQLHMWRIRRIHFGMKWFATALTTIMQIVAQATTLVVTLGFIGLAFALRAYWSDPVWGWSSMLGLNLIVSLACARCVYLIIRATDKVHGVELDLIKNSILTGSIQGHRDIKLHDIVSQQLFRDKNQILHEEEKRNR